MNNSEKFKSVFGIYATELWAMPEEDFLKWLNKECDKSDDLRITKSAKDKNVPHWKVENGLLIASYSKRREDRNG